MVTSPSMQPSAMPATFSTASTRPNFSTAAATMASTSASLVTSQCTGNTPATDLGGRVLLGAADVTGHDLGALTDEDLDRRLPHPRSRAGDDRHLAVQETHHMPPMCSRLRR